MAVRERGESEICWGHPLLPAGGGNLVQPTSLWACFCCMPMEGWPVLLAEHSSLFFTMLVCSSPEQITETCRSNRYPEAEAGVTEKIFSMQKKSHLSVLACTMWLWAGWVCTIARSITRHRLPWVPHSFVEQEEGNTTNSSCKDLAH